MSGRLICALIFVGLLAPALVSAAPLDRYSVPNQDSANDSPPPRNVSADVFERFKVALKGYDTGKKQTLLQQLEVKRKDMLKKNDIKAAKYYDTLIQILRDNLDDPAKN